MQEFTEEEWISEGERRFGADISKWEFKCPVCGHYQTLVDFVGLITPADINAHVYIRHFLKKTPNGGPLGGDGPGPCDSVGQWALSLNKAAVVVISKDGTKTPVFEFSPEEGVKS